MKIVIAYLKDEIDSIKNTLSKAKKLNAKKKYINFLETKLQQFEKSFELLSERKTSTEADKQHDSKALHIADVSNQRELLIAFSYWFNKNVKQRDNFIFKVEEFLEQYKSNS